MKTFLASLAIALAGTTAWSAETASLTGKWKIHNSIAGNESDQDCTFTQSGKDITGSCSVEQGSTQVTGKVEDNKITWEYKTEYDGSPLTLEYTGTLDKDSKLAGTVEVQPLGVSGDFTGTPAK